MIYKIYAFFKVLKDKMIQKMMTYYTNTYTTVERLDDTIIPSIFGDFLNLVTVEPTHVIDNIYIGNAYNASDYYTLQNYKITHIVNISEEISNYFPDHFNYLQIDILDDKNASITPHLDDFINYVDNVPSNENVFVHCFMGSSRSASLVLVYLIRKHNMTFTDAYNFLKQKRPIVNLNVEFAKQIKNNNFIANI